MRDAISPDRGPSPTEEFGEHTLTSREFVALTGVSAERVRTWQRRFGFPASTPDRRGRRGFFASDVPRVLAVKQMVAAGEPVADAVRGVLAGRSLHADTDVLEASFGALATPVVAIAGPAPTEVFWANAAAREAAPGGPAAVQLPHGLSERGSTLHSLLIEPPGEPVWLAHRPWFAASEPDHVEALPTPARAMAWSLGAPAFVPAVLVVIDVPSVEEAESTSDGAEASGSPRQQALVEHEWATAIGAARRALQRGAGGKAVDQALGALVAGGVARDAVVVVQQAEELRAVRTTRGHLVTAPLSAAAARELRAALDDVPVVLGSAVADELADAEGACAIATPLVAGRVEVGYLVLISDADPDLGAAHVDLITAFATTLAAAITRDRAAAALRRVRGD